MYGDTLRFLGSRISSEEELGRPDLSRTSTSKSQNSLNMFQGGSLGRRTGANGTGVLIDINDAGLCVLALPDVAPFLCFM